MYLTETEKHLARSVCKTDRARCFSVSAVNANLFAASPICSCECAKTMASQIRFSERLNSQSKMSISTLSQIQPQ